MVFIGIGTFSAVCGTTAESQGYLCKMHPLCVNPDVPERVRRHTSCTCDNKASSPGIHADVTDTGMRMV